jgi:hypothetical protein
MHAAWTSTHLGAKEQKEDLSRGATKVSEREMIATHLYKPLYQTIH